MNIYIAAATTDGISIEHHFGHAKEYQIISVDEDTEQWKLIETRKVNIPLTLAVVEGACFGKDEKNIEYIAELLKGCTYILVNRIGPKPQKIIQRYGIEALETDLSIDENIKQILRYRKRRWRNEE